MASQNTSASSAGAPLKKTSAQARKSQKRLNADLYQAVQADDEAQARKALAAGANLNEAVSDRENHLLRDYNALQAAVLRKNAPMIELLLENGALPNFFNAGVTAVGLCAYTFFCDGLEAMAKHGADTRLLLLPEHTQDESALHTTLLHRIMTRHAMHGQEMTEKSRIVIFLAERELAFSGQPFPLTQSGRSPLDGAIEDDALTALRAWFARRIEAPALAQAVQATGESAAREPIRALRI